MTSQVIESIRERILSQSIVANGEPFAIHRLASRLGLSKSCVAHYLREMSVDGDTEWVEDGIYRLRKGTRDLICRSWVKGRFDPGHFRGGEWAQ